jgi:Membrane proteins related to metalloendopeptidases
MMGLSSFQVGWLAVVMCLQPHLAAAEFGQFFKVNPRPSATSTDPLSQPTRVPLTKLKLKPGDYVGMRNFGDFATHPIPTETDHTMFGAFAKAGQLLNFDSSLGTIYLPVGCRTPKGFWLNWNDFPTPIKLRSPWTIYKMPVGTTELVFESYCLGGGKQAVDNDNDFGVRITRPNSPPATVGATNSANRTVANPFPIEANKPDLFSDPNMHALFAKMARDKDSLPLLSLDSRSLDPRAGSLGIISQLPITSPQYRGWHVANNQCLAATGKSTCWSPTQSTFCNKGVACPRKQNHWGIDLFAPEGSMLRAPLRARVYQTFTTDFGHVAALAFRAGVAPNATDYVLMFAHLHREPFFDGDIVAKGTFFAATGCTGKSVVSQRCGTELTSAPSTAGARSDHVHVELIRGNALKLIAPGGWPPKPVNRLNPSAALGWVVSTPN